MSVTAAVEAVGADHLLGKTYGGNQVLDGVELEGSHVHLLADVLHHLGVFGCGGVRDSEKLMNSQGYTRGGQLMRTCTSLAPYS